MMICWMPIKEHSRKLEELLKKCYPFIIIGGFFIGVGYGLRINKVLEKYETLMYNCG